MAAPRSYIAGWFRNAASDKACPRRFINSGVLVPIAEVASVLFPSRSKSWLVVPRLVNLNTEPIVESVPGLDHHAVRAAMHCHGELIKESSLAHHNRPGWFPRSQEPNSSIPLCNHLGSGIEGTFQQLDVHGSERCGPRSAANSDYSLNRIR